MKKIAVIFTLFAVILTILAPTSSFLWAKDDGQLLTERVTEHRYWPVVIEPDSYYLETPFQIIDSLPNTNLDLSGVKLIIKEGYNINAIEVLAQTRDIKGLTIIGGEVDGQKSLQTKGSNQYLQNGLFAQGSSSYQIYDFTVRDFKSHDNPWHGTLLAGYDWYPAVKGGVYEYNGGSGIRFDAVNWSIIDDAKVRYNDIGAYQEGGRVGIWGGIISRDNVRYGVHTLNLIDGGIITEFYSILDPYALMFIASSNIIATDGKVVQTANEHSAFRVEGEGSTISQNYLFDGNLIKGSPIAYHIRFGTENITIGDELLVDVGQRISNN